MILAAAMLAQAFAFLPPSDPRIRLETYQPGRVVTVVVTPGFAVVIALGPDERVENIVVGDSAGWQVTASKRGDDVVVKPLAGATTTNMIVATGDRHYVFQLQPGEAVGGSPYMLRFVDPAPIAVTPGRALGTYRITGAKELTPVAMSDDGTRTTIAWGKDTPLPAIFAVERDGREAIVNGRMVAGAFVVERIALRFVFRLGKSHATAVRRVEQAPR